MKKILKIDAYTKKSKLDLVIVTKLCLKDGHIRFLGWCFFFLINFYTPHRISWSYVKCTVLHQSSS